MVSGIGYALRTIQSLPSAMAGPDGDSIRAHANSVTEQMNRVIMDASSVGLRLGKCV
jgi:hypothetical protein